MKTIFIFLFVLKVSLQVNVKNETLCEGRPSPCCAGYMLSTNSGSCVACSLGYFGPKCKWQCPYPQFGRFCQRRCLCDRKKCNKRTGCIRDINPGVLQTVKPFSTTTELFPALNKSNAIPKSFLRSRGQEDNDVQRESIAAREGDRATPIRYTIASLVGLSVLLMTLYFVSTVVKKYRRPGKSMNLEKRENMVNSAKEKEGRF
ncbi:uncharacterized protein LOC134278390 [Saccostrea cucullata]|uniref:uncharacterized protein LOC134278390 n=1 Tax=Saccostrea cuccullata TaxID=36930 RepID=UPI002ED50D22